MSSFKRRVAVTTLLPIGIVVIGSRITVPTISGEMVDAAHLTPSMFSVFALGIAPILSALWVVELAAIVVPPWRRLRNGDPGGRVKLDRASLVVGLVFAVLQSLAMAMTLAVPMMQSQVGGAVSIPLLTATFVGGTCVALFLASIIRRQGLIDGFVAIFGAGAAAGVVEEIFRAFTDRRSTFGQIALEGLAIVALVAASWAVFRKAHVVPGETSTKLGEGPYREVHIRAKRRLIPLPASSLKPLSTAAGIVSSCGLLWNVVVRRSSATLPSDEPGKMAVSLVITFVVAFVFTWLLHRPKAMAAVAARDASSLHPALIDDLRKARARALVPTFAFLGLIVLLEPVTHFVAESVVILVATALDFAHALKTGRLDSTRVVAWEERHAWSVPVLRAALAAEGIDSEVRGAAFLNAFQIFAPYAPAKILVAGEDGARAIAIIRHLVLGEAPAAPTSSAAVDTLEPASA